jgi:hypothetical protein
MEVPRGKSGPVDHDDDETGARKSDQGQGHEHLRHVGLERRAFSSRHSGHDGVNDGDSAARFSPGRVAFSEATARFENNRTRALSASPDVSTRADGKIIIRQDARSLPWAAESRPR